MSISFEIPQDIERQLRSSGADPNTEAREAFLVDLYRRDRITHGQLGKALGLDAYETDGVLKQHGVGFGITAEELRAEALSLAEVRPERHVVTRTYTLGPESEEQLLEETILEWRAQGPEAAWQAIYDMLDWWCESRNLDPEAQRVDRTHSEVHRVPWLDSVAEPGDDA